MKFKIMMVLFADVLLFVSASISMAQNNFDFKVGETIYVNAFYGGCVKAKVTQTDPKYSVRIQEGTYKDRETFYSANRISECKQTAQQNNQAQNNQNANEADDTPQQPNNGNFKLGERVDVYLSDNKTGKARGTVIEAESSRYKVHYDGCKDYWDEWVNITLLRPAAMISADNADVKFLVGKWGMTTVGISDSAISWGKSPGIQIKSDGSYIWYQDGGKTPVKGEWTTHAKIEGAKNGTEVLNGIIIKDDKGAQWKMYRRKSTSDKADHITIEQMCQGITKIGTRVQ